MRLIAKDFVSMEVEFVGNEEKAFLLGAFSCTLYDFEITKTNSLQIDVPIDELDDFYDFLTTTFNNYKQYMRK